MSRRRLTLPAYLRRRWRSVGAVIVLLLGSLLVLGVTDRGHDPAWETRVGEIDQAALAPDASIAYLLLREDDNVSGLVALRGIDGERLWEGPIHAPRAVLAAGEMGVAVATDFPLAFLTMYNADGSPRWQVPLEGNPVAIAMEGQTLALALTAPGNPILVFQDGALVRTYHMPSPARALDLESGLVASGGLRGEVLVWRDGTQVVNMTLPMGIRSLRLSQDGTSLVAGGFGLAPTDTRGHVAFLDVGVAQPLRWIADTLVGVGLVDIDALGLRVLAVEEAPPTATVHVYEGATGATRWTRELTGSVSREDDGGSGGAAMSPDGEFIAVATLRGVVRVLETDDGRERWSYRAGGAGVITFADEEARRLLVGGRLLENRPAFDSVLLFSTAGEPVGQRAPLLAGAILAIATVTLSLLVGLGFWRARKPY
jgi:hypothetical protein